MKFLQAKFVTDIASDIIGILCRRRSIVGFCVNWIILYQANGSLEVGYSEHIIWHRIVLHMVS